MMQPLKPALLSLNLLCLACLLLGCSTRRAVHPVVVSQLTDTVFITLPPPPPVVIPADSTKVVLNLHLLCDSLWRSQQPETLSFARSQRLKAHVRLSDAQVTFSCREDSLLVLLDSIRTHKVTYSKAQYQEVTLYKCPYGWPKLLHLVVLIAIVLCLVLTLLLSLKRLR